MEACDAVSTRKKKQLILTTDAQEYSTSRPSSTQISVVAHPATNKTHLWSDLRLPGGRLFRT